MQKKAALTRLGKAIFTTGSFYDEDLIKAEQARVSINSVQRYRSSAKRNERKRKAKLSEAMGGRAKSGARSSRG